MKAKTFESIRLVYEPVTMKHLSQHYVDWINDEDVNKFLDTRGNYTLNKLKLFLEEQEKKDIFFWAIRLKENRKHIGNIKIDPIDETINSGEYGILLGDKDEWGKGYAKEASVAIIDHCFNEIGLSQITLGVIEDHNKALVLYQKLGFKIEKIIKNKGVYNGKKCNAVRMALKKDD